MPDPGHTIINRGIVTLGGAFVTPINLLKLESMDWYAADDQTQEEINALNIDAATVNGLTVETAVPVGAVFTDTHVPVVNNLLSTEDAMALSANMGRVLDEKITDAVTDITSNYQDIQLLQADTHTHTNKGVLDNLGINASDELTYNGNKVDTVIAQRDVYNGLDSTDTTVSLTAAQGKVLNDKITTNTANIASNTSNIASNTTDIASNTTNIATNASNITANVNNIAANAASITTLNSTATTNAAAIASNSTDITNLQAISHTHPNKLVLDKFGEDVSGIPTYNGNVIDTTIAQRDVYDGLDSTDNTISLAANQGSILDTKIATNTQQITTNASAFTGALSSLATRTTDLEADAHTHANKSTLDNLGTNATGDLTWQGEELIKIDTSLGMFLPAVPIETMKDNYPVNVSDLRTTRLWVRIPASTSSNMKVFIREQLRSSLNTYEITLSNYLLDVHARTVTDSTGTVEAFMLTTDPDYAHTIYLKIEYPNNIKFHSNTYGNVQPMVVKPNSIPSVEHTKFLPLPFEMVRPELTPSIDKDTSTWQIVTTPGNVTSLIDPAVDLFAYITPATTAISNEFLVNDGYFEITFDTPETIKYAIISSSIVTPATIDLSVQVSDDNGATWVDIWSVQTYTLNSDIDVSNNTIAGSKVRFNISNISDTTKSVFTGISFYFL